jgi:hypothetical protein
VSKSFSRSRRSVLRGSVAGAAAALLAGVLPASKLRAADLPEVSEDDPTAKGLKYVADATKSARPDASQLCNNCRYYKGAASAAKAPCDLFPGKSVNGNGWCSAWMKK